MIVLCALELLCTCICVEKNNLNPTNRCWALWSNCAAALNIGGANEGLCVPPVLAASSSGIIISK